MHTCVHTTHIHKAHITYYIHTPDTYTCIHAYTPHTHTTYTKQYTSHTTYTHIAYTYHIPQTYIPHYTHTYCIPYIHIPHYTHTIHTHRHVHTYTQHTHTQHTQSRVGGGDPGSYMLLRSGKDKRPNLLKRVREKLGKECQGLFQGSVVDPRNLRGPGLLPLPLSCIQMRATGHAAMTEG